MLLNNYLEENISFDSLPNEVHALNQKMDMITTLLKSSKPDQQENKFLTIDEAAKFLNLSKSTIYSKVSRGELPHMKKGKRLYFFQDELMDYIKSGKIKTVVELESEVDKYLTSHKRSMQGNIQSVTKLKNSINIKNNQK